ncbi:MAG: hypothetical protein QNI99_02960 [Woeseiaceae bacterium]|nr:hypothetical protein [Woeseiaceae bacterium]
MTGSFLDIAIYAAAALIAGCGVGWLIRGGVMTRRISIIEDDWQSRLDDAVRERDHYAAETHKLRSRLEEQEAVLQQHKTAYTRSRTELESAQEREKRLSKDIFTLRNEREEFKTKLSTIQAALVKVRQQTADVQNEFLKSRDFYTAELRKSFEKRQHLEAKLEDAREEHSSFATLLQSSRSEHDSVNKMLASAQARLTELDKLEENVIRLEAENAQLSHDARMAQQEIDVLRRDVAELEELKVQNREMAHCLESMENSRQQYESDAKRYKDHADEQEKRSETLAIRLDEVEKNFAEIEKQQLDALKEARETSMSEASNDDDTDQVQEIDDLQEIVGIGKVFERNLHDLGIYSFRQIASFGPSDIARVNQELKEFRGRMEQDDWIGQAKELLFKKYGSRL